MNQPRYDSLPLAGEDGEAPFGCGDAEKMAKAKWSWLVCLNMGVYSTSKQLAELSYVIVFVIF